MTKHVPQPSIYDLSAIERELESWWRDLNLIVGPLALTMAIGCKSLSYWPAVIFNIAASLAIVSIAHGIRPRYTTRVGQLRELAKHDPKAAEVLKFTDENFLGNWRYCSFLVGFISLGLLFVWLAFGGFYSCTNTFPQLKPYLPVVCEERS